MALARAALAVGGLDEVWLLADPAPWHKSVVAGVEDRLTMLALAVAAGGEPRVRLVEGDLGMVPHTLAGFGRILERHAGKRFVFILGMDALIRLDRWEDYESIVNTTSLMAAGRTGLGSVAVEGLRQRLGELGGKLDVRLFEFEHPASATVIRERAREGVRPEWLEPAVWRYIEERGLYRS